MNGQNEVGYAESLLNIVLDQIDDIIMIHDSEYTVVWMNRAGTEKFNISLEKVIGKSCFTLFGKNAPCENCSVTAAMIGCRCENERIIPGRAERYRCTTIPLSQDGEVKLIVQHLRKKSD
ncbi:MAG: PAS domain-containing protein [Methanomassiliicoccaceae archaeon]|jgi:PAS domain-containing protein|nr:PAS domain-containing protein [Methanomassiliicoccaceae archaeon]